MIFIILTIFSYFAAFVGILALGGKKNAYGDKIAIGASLVSLVAFFVMLASSRLQGEFIFASYRISGFTFDFGFLIDKLSLLMGGIVSFVTTLVLFYSRDYMRKDPDRGRFFALLCFFAGSMLGIVYSVSFVQLFIFWELVGLSSYFLIGFWWKDPQVSSSARKVFTTIVIGDVFLLTGFLVLGGAFGTFTFSEMIREHVHVALPAMGVFLVLLGAFTKSAQLPFSMWLPWAMEGPTPVSALLHSATMVKAGVFLIARILPLVFAAHLSDFVVVVALATILAASFFALVEKDIKRILAYSTISQLGFIALGLGLGAYGAALFHLFNDAFYKALLFLGAGVIIHAGGSRNIFELKPLHWVKEKAFLVLTLIGALGISGIPPFNGFFSKDLIIDAARETHNTALFVLVLGAAFLSGLYISRWLFLIFRKVEYPSTGSGNNKSVPERSPFDRLRVNSTESKGANAPVEHFAGGHDVSEKWKSAQDMQLTPSLRHSVTFHWSSKIPMGILAGGVILSGLAFAQFFAWLDIAEKPHYDRVVSIASVALALCAWALSYALYIRRAAFLEWLVGACGVLRAAIEARFGLLWFYGVLWRFVSSLGEALSVFDRYIIDSVLAGAAKVAGSLAVFASTIDRYVIDGLLHGMARTVVAVCFGSLKLDMRGIDGIVQSFYAGLMAAGSMMRRLVSGSATAYVTAVVAAAIVSILLLNGVLAK